MSTITESQRAWEEKIDELTVRAARTRGDAMTRPIGPRERLVLAAAEAYDAASKAATAAAEALFGKSDGPPVGAGLARLWRSHIDDARKADAAAETWLTWTWDRRAKAWVAQIDPRGAQYRVEVYPRDLLGTAECDPEGPGPWQAAIFTAVFGNMVPCASANEGKALCEDHARQRGQFAPEET